MRIFLTLSVVCMSLAGCAGTNPQPDAPDAILDSGTTTAASRRGPSDSDGSIVVQAPEWEAGDWWTWVITTQDSDPFEVTTVVTSVTNQAYRVGITDLDKGLHAFANHALPMGVIQRPDFSWEVHDSIASVIQFPLQAGMTWAGEEEGRELLFTAEATTVRTPDGEMPAVEVLGSTDYGPGVGYTYLPSIENFASYSIYYGNDEPYATATWIANGKGATEATVVESDDVLITFDYMPRPPDLPSINPTVTFEVPASATHVMMVCSMGGDGTQEAHILSPSGAKLSCQRTPPMPANQTYAATRGDAEAGTWLARTLVTGGYIEAEVYALILTPEQV